MLIMKISGLMISAALEGKLLPHYNSKPRKIEFAALINFTGTNLTIPGFHWTVSPVSFDAATGKPKQETFTTSDGKSITCIVLKFTYTGPNTLSQANPMIIKEFYLRAYDAVVEISKLFISIIEKDMLKFSKIEFVEQKNSPSISDTNEFTLAPSIIPLATAPNYDCLNKSYYINKDFSQFNSLIFKLYSQQGAPDKPVRILLQDYKTLSSADKGTELNTQNSFPTFQDFIDVYQALLHSDPTVHAANLNNLINVEKAKLTKQTNAINAFKQYMTNFDTRLKSHIQAILNIIGP